MITWRDRVANLTKALGRRPSLDELLAAAWIHQMTPAELEQQRASFALGGFPWRCYDASCTTPGDCILNGCQRTRKPEERPLP